MSFSDYLPWNWFGGESRLEQSQDLPPPHLDETDQSVLRDDDFSTSTPALQTLMETSQHTLAHLQLILSKDSHHTVDITICGQEQTTPMPRKSGTQTTMIRSILLKLIKIKQGQGSLLHLPEPISGMSSTSVMKSSRDFHRLIFPRRST